jgi:hypothetical protein
MEYINESMLEDLGDKFEVIDALIAQEKYSEQVRDIYNSQLEQKLLLLAYANPSLEDYPATPKIGLCKLIKYAEENDSFLAGATELHDFMRRYLQDNKSHVNSDIEDSQKWLGGEGCEVTGTGERECWFKDKSRCKKRHNQPLKNDAKESAS